MPETDMHETDPVSRTLTRHAEVVAVLCDPVCIVPPLAAVADSGSGIGWLRASVSRFSSGAEHARRRALVRDALAGLDPEALRRRAGELTRERTKGLPAGVAAPELERVPVTVLAEALGIAGPVVPLVAAISQGYFPGTDGGAAADEAVDALVTILSGRYDEQTAATIAILVQAHAATNALVANTLTAYARLAEPAAVEPSSVEAMVAETLRFDPPARVMRRQCAQPYAGNPAGTLLVLDVAAANRDPDVFADPDRFDPDRTDALGQLAFGFGLRPCPGGDHATAITAGIVAAVLANERTASRPIP